MNASINPFINYLLANRIIFLENGDRFCTHIGKVIRKLKEKKRKKIKNIGSGKWTKLGKQKNSKLFLVTQKQKLLKKLVFLQ